MLDDLRLERSPPPVERKPLLGCSLGFAPFDCSDLLDDHSKPRRVVHEAGEFTLALVQRRLRRVRASEKPHASRPERVLLRRVEPLKLVAQAVEEPLRVDREVSHSSQFVSTCLSTRRRPGGRRCLAMSEQISILVAESGPMHPEPGFPFLAIADMENVGEVASGCQSRS